MSTPTSYDPSTIYGQFMARREAEAVATQEAQRKAAQARNMDNITNGHFPAGKAKKGAEARANKEHAFTQSERIVGEMLPAPSEPALVARTLATRYDSALRWWRGGYYVHAGANWKPEDEAVVKGWLYRVTESASYQTVDEKGDKKLKAWAPNRKKIADVEEALSRGVLQFVGEEWRGMALQNGVLVDGELLPHSPDRFNLASLPYDYTPKAEAPNWLAFLDSSLPGEILAHQFLQEWFGYVLSGRTDLQMMASLVGASRSGKGVMVRVLEAMLGKGNSTGVTLKDLIGDYGLSGLIGKSLATISEPQWASREAGQAVEPLLRITGNDTVRANIKFRPEWVGRLGTRFMILSNETPRLVNRSGALANRMTHVRFNVSFAGREDITLEDRLLTELPGILNWALVGLARLEANGRFTVPEGHGAMNAKFRDYADPDADFLETHCLLGEEFQIDQKSLHNAYVQWCEDMGRTRDSTDVTALRHRLTDREGITQARVGKAKVWTLFGIGVRPESLPRRRSFDPADD